MKMTIPFSMLYQGLLLATSGLYTGLVIADPARPDAGQTLQQLQSMPLPTTAPMTVPPLDLQETPPVLTADHEARFLVKQIHVQGSTVFSSAELESLLVSLKDSELSMTDLTNAARLLTSFYRHHGYPVARAYLPAQTISNGEVTIQILEGRLDKVLIKNHSPVSDARLQSLINAYVTPGQVLSVPSINRGLLLMGYWFDNDAHVRGVLQAGDTVGTSNLVVNVPESKRYRGEVILDNHGNRFTGQDRLSGHLVVYNPLSMGDRLDMRSSVSNEDLAYGQVFWETPVTNSGLRLGVDLNYSRYVLGDIFAPLDIHGTSQTMALAASYPLRMSLKTPIVSIFSLKHKQLDDVVVSVDSKKTIKSAEFTVFGQYAANAKLSVWQIVVTTGKLDISTPLVLAVDQSSAKTNGNYAKVVVSANTLQTLSPKLSAYLAFNGQRASKNLDTAEKFALGGVNAIRAYPTGEGLGDQGWQATAELRYNLLPSLQGVVFYDVGGIDINRRAYIANANNSRHLSGEGIGFNASLAKNWQLKLNVAWRGNEEPLSDKDQKPRVWAQGIYQF